MASEKSETPDERASASLHDAGESKTLITQVEGDAEDGAASESEYQEEFSQSVGTAQLKNVESYKEVTDLPKIEGRDTPEVAAKSSVKSRQEDNVSGTAEERSKEIKSSASVRS